MTLSRLSRLLVPLSALGLLVVLAVDLMRVVRPSGLSAAACTATLFRPKPDTQSLVARYRDALGANLSLGLGQLRLSTAARLDGKSWETLSASEYRDIRSRLLLKGRPDDLQAASRGVSLHALRTGSSC